MRIPFLRCVALRPCRVVVYACISCASVAPAARAFQAQALVARYTLDELDGMRAYDESSSSEHGLYRGGVELGLPGVGGGSTAVRFRAAQAGQVQVEEHFGLGLVRGNVSVSAWVRPTADAPVMGIFGAAESGWACARTPDGLRFDVRFVQEFHQPCDVPLGDWTHVAFVFDAAYDVTFFVDGARVGTIAGIWPAYGAGPEWSAGSMDGVSDFWDGLLDDVQVYVGALTDEEVAWLQANPGAAIDPIVGTPYCFGDGHGTPCPCFNYGLPDGGCVNSTDRGARLRSRGSNGVGADDLGFSCEQVPAGQPALLFAGTDVANQGSGVVFGDGLRCTQGATVRLGIRPADEAGQVEWRAGLARAGGWVPGDTRGFQAWYRDAAGPCGSGFNTSQAIRIRFLP